MPIKVEALDHVTVQITDVARAKKFYGEVIGLEEVERPESFDFSGAWFRTPNALIHLVSQEKADAASRRHFCLWVADVKGAAKMFETAGYPAQWNTKNKIPGIDRFFVYDPDNNRIEIQGSDGTVWSA